VSTDDHQMSIEDRVRSATQAGASLIRDVRPLGTAAPVRLRPQPARAPRRWLSWGIPLVAAAAVVALALTLVAVRQPSAPARPAVPSTPTAVPRYYATLDVDAQGDLYTGPLIVGDDLTGKVVATVAPPPGLVFDTVQGTADDRTFVVMAGSKTADGSAPFTWCLIRIFPGTAHPYQLTRLSMLPASTYEPTAYALSPDGQELAVESHASASTSSPTTVTLYSVASGARLRSWTTNTNVTSGVATATLSWLTGGRQLVFSVGRFTTGSDYSLQLRTLDVTGSGTDLLAASRALLTVNNAGPSSCLSLHITPDGETAICATQFNFLSGGGSNEGCANGGLEFTAYSIRTGNRVRVLYLNRGACHNGEFILLWTDASASEIIGATGINLANEGGKQAFQLGVITDGHFRPLNIANSVSPWDYGRAAF